MTKHYAQKEEDLSKAIARMTSIAPCIGTWGRGRTGTVLLPLVFETNASTYSATQAKVLFGQARTPLNPMFVDKIVCSII